MNLDVSSYKEMLQTSNTSPGKENIFNVFKMYVFPVVTTSAILFTTFCRPLHDTARACGRGRL